MYKIEKRNTWSIYMANYTVAAPGSIKTIMRTENMVKACDEVRPEAGPLQYINIWPEHGPLTSLTRSLQ